ncbi:hypothetical protein GCM10010277_87930 [Streptomyces longisporoflavus]|uniref:hypothetical protein n=1 Tax=Streptomyces longisporoflavus TaxID=28044 RepID=UPI0019A2AEE0|nr:hypothetical protein [Streptomyces longisporoflavus]GGV73983.1 hypothetical protein GCM10010277_87930 [Streptomyces longisporoflavus]
MTRQPPVYILINPDGRAHWGHRLSVAEDAMGHHGIGRTFLTPTSRLRVASPGRTPTLPDQHPPNLYAARVLAHVAGHPPHNATEPHGPVALYGFDPTNEWDNTRPLTTPEQHAITRALAAAGCTTA